MRNAVDTVDHVDYRARADKPTNAIALADSIRDLAARGLKEHDIAQIFGIGTGAVQQALKGIV